MFGFGKNKNKNEIKAYPAASYFLAQDQVQFQELSYEALAKEGYKLNAIAFRCISMIAQSGSSLDFKVKVGDEYVENHPIEKLLNNPNPAMSRQQLMKYLISYFLINGNSYVFNGNIDKEPSMIWALNPKDVKAVQGASMASAYEVAGFKRSNKQHLFPVDPLTGECAILQIKDFDPISYFYGQSKLQACAHAIDTFNESMRWNYSLLKNGGKPDGFLTPKGDAQMTEEQYNHAYSMVQREFNGANNAGGTKLLGNFEWTQASLSPKDMDFKESQIMAARYIANCFGVPSQMLNIPESQTFSNYEQANLSFWQDTVIPLTNEIYSSLTRWLTHYYKEDDIKIEVDLDKVTALDVVRRERSERLRAEVTAGIRTINEARQALNLQEKQGGDDLFISGAQVPLSFAADVESQVEEEAKAEYEEFIRKAEDDGEINSFADSKFPDRPSFAFIEDIKDNYPEMWRKVGNGGSGEDRTSFTGKDAFRRWSAYNDGDRTQSVLNWLKRRESFVARFRNNVSNWEGMLALGMWAGVPSDGGFDRMKSILNEQKKKVREARD